VQGGCALQCGGSATKCGAYCVSTKSDPENCGGCGTKCAQGQVCNLGKCDVTCQQGLTDCSGACLDLQQDDDNCGMCGNACNLRSEMRRGRKCQATCQNGWASCPTDGGTTCVNLNLDVTNCGACGVTCPNGQFCSPGADGGMATCGLGLLRRHDEVRKQMRRYLAIDSAKLRRVRRALQRHVLQRAMLLGKPALLQRRVSRHVDRQEQLRRVRNRLRRHLQSRHVLRRERRPLQRKVREPPVRLQQLRHVRQGLPDEHARMLGGNVRLVRQRLLVAARLFDGGRTLRSLRVPRGQRSRNVSATSASAGRRSPTTSG